MIRNVMPRCKVKTNEPAPLTVRERFEAAVHAYRQENPASQPPVALVCRLAGLNRANIYATHPDLVASLRASRLSQPRPREVVPQDGQRVSSKVKDEGKYLKALLYLCLELRAEVESLRALRESDRKRLSARKDSKR